MAKRIVWTEQAKADVRSIEQPVALQSLKTLARYIQAGEGDTKQLKGVHPPMIRLRAQQHRVFFRDHGEHLEITRVSPRDQAYRPL
jgi:mRNA-degrading endonuclease RelE of RelBE toxin-antitoxin system